MHAQYGCMSRNSSTSGERNLTNTSFRRPPHTLNAVLSDNRVSDMRLVKVVVRWSGCACD